MQRLRVYQQSNVNNDKTIQKAKRKLTLISNKYQFLDTEKSFVALCRISFVLFHAYHG